MNRKVFFDAVRKSVFGGHLSSGQVEGLTRTLDFWQAHWPKMIVEELAYVLATFEWECAHTMRPIEEGYPATGEKLRAYQRKLRYSPWFGRGPPQLTWEANYKKFHVFGDPNTTLDQAPEKMLEWDTGLSVLFEGMIKGVFTSHKLADYIARDHQDYVGAREIINGRDRAAQIAATAVKFLSALRAAEAAEPEQEKPKVSTGAKVGGTIATTGTAAAGANVAMGGDEWTSALVAGGSLLAGLVSWLAPKLKNMVSSPRVETPAPKPPPPEEIGEIIEPTEITHSQTAAYDAAKAHLMALEEEVAAARAAVEAERLKVIERAEALLAAIGAVPNTQNAVPIPAPVHEPAPAVPAITGE